MIHSGFSLVVNFDLLEDVQTYRWCHFIDQQVAGLQKSFNALQNLC